MTNRVQHFDKLQPDE